MPVVLAGGYAAGPLPVLSAVFIMISITSFGYVIARLRLETGSIWPAIVLHAAWNSVIRQRSPTFALSRPSTARLFSAASFANPRQRPAEA